MGNLNYAAREDLPSSEFGLPGERKYPMPDKAHAANAKARATQMANRGVISGAQKAEIDAKANAKLRRGPVSPAGADVRAKAVVKGGRASANEKIDGRFKAHLQKPKANLF